MIFRAKVEAGVMLYALLMLAIFSLLLQFYVAGMTADVDLNRASRDSYDAYLMAVLARDNLASSKEKKEPSSKGEMAFSRGRVAYEKGKEAIEVVVQLDKGGEYRYTFSSRASQTP